MVLLDGNYNPAVDRAIAFGSHTFDLRTRTLSRNGQAVPLQSQPAELLALLIERRDGVVTREEIRARVWPDTVVDYDQGINYAVRHVRAALGPDGHLVRTVPRRGYRFTGDVVPANAGRPRVSRLAMAAGVAAVFGSIFAAGLLASHTEWGDFIYIHLAHPDRCPYVRMIVPALRAS